MKNTSNAAPNLRIRHLYLLNIFKKKKDPIILINIYLCSLKLFYNNYY